MKKLHLSLYLIFAVSATIILLNRYTSLHLSDYRVHFFFLFFGASSFVIIVGHFFQKLRTNTSILITFLLVGIICFLKAYLTWSGDWKTQTVLYQNSTDKSKTINAQMRSNRFQFGYNNRIIEIKDLAPFIQWTTDIDTSAIDPAKWEKVNIDLNELKLPKE